jgi:hypothetical protein
MLCVKRKCRINLESLFSKGVTICQKRIKIKEQLRDKESEMLCSHASTQLINGNMLYFENYKCSSLFNNVINLFFFLSKPRGIMLVEPETNERYLQVQKELIDTEKAYLNYLQLLKNVRMI